MTNKQQIEELVEVIGVIRPEISHTNGCERTVICMHNRTNEEIAEALYNAGYRKIDENHIVIPLDGSKLVIPRKDQQTLLHAMYEQARKATAKEIFSKLREKRTKSFLDWEGNICHLDEEYVSMREIEAVLKQLGVEEQE